MRGRLTTMLSRDDDTAVLALAGALDFGSAARVREQLLKICEKPPAVVTVDCTGLRFVDSTGIGLFVAAFRRLDAAGCRFMLANVDETVGKTLRLTGVDKFLTVHWYDERGAALAG